MAAHALRDLTGRGTQPHDDRDDDEDETPGMSMQRTGSVVYSSPTLSVCVYPEAEQAKGNWVDAVEICGGKADGQPLLPKDISRADIEQGSHADCFFITACSIVAESNPELIRSLFLTKEWPKEESGKQTFKFRFWRWDKWQEVHVDSMVPCDAKSQGGKPSFARSPNGRAWPLILEKAYAAFYGGFECLEGGNLAETIRDLTGKPVENVILDQRGPEKNLGFWKELSSSGGGGAKKSTGAKVILSAGTNKLPATEKMGLQKAHAYGILAVHVDPAAKGPGAATAPGVVIKLMNPYRGRPYTGPGSKKGDGKICKEVLKVLDATGGGKAHDDDEDNVFFMRLQDFFTTFSRMQVCRLDAFTQDTLDCGGARSTLHTAKHFDFALSSKDGTAGGRNNYQSWKTNPCYTVENKSGEDVEIWCTITQPERRTLNTKRNEAQGTGEHINYLPLAVELSCLPEVPGTMTTLFRTASNRKELFVTSYLNQREQSVRVVVPKTTTLAYLVVSSFEPGEETKGLLSVAVPSALANTCQVHSLKGHYAQLDAGKSSSTGVGSGVVSDPADGKGLVVDGIPDATTKGLWKLSLDGSTEEAEQGGCGEGGDKKKKSGALAVWKAKGGAKETGDKVELHVLLQQCPKASGKPDNLGGGYYRLKLYTADGMCIGGGDDYSNFAERAIVADVSEEVLGGNTEFYLQAEFGKQSKTPIKQSLKLTVKARPAYFVDVELHAVKSLPVSGGGAGGGTSTPPPAMRAPAPTAGGGGKNSSGARTTGGRSPAPPVAGKGKKTTTTTTTTTTRPGDTTGGKKVVSRTTTSTSHSAAPAPAPKKNMMTKSRAGVGGIASMYGDLE